MKSAKFLFLVRSLKGSNFANWCPIQWNRFAMLAFSAQTIHTKEIFVHSHPVGIAVFNRIWFELAKQSIIFEQSNILTHLFIHSLWLYCRRKKKNAIYRKYNNNLMKVWKYFLIKYFTEHRRKLLSKLSICFIVNIHNVKRLWALAV